VRAAFPGEYRRRPGRRCHMNAAPAASHQAHAPRGWTHHIPVSFFECSDLDPGLERLVLRLEGLARDKPWCFTSNNELLELLRCSRNTLADALRRGEQLGWFRRALIPGRHGRATGRLGIVLFIRPTDRPVATPETFDLVVDLMRAEIRRGRTGRRPGTLPFPAPIPRESAAATQELGTMVPKNWAPTVPKNWAPSPYSKEEVTEKETETTTTARHDAQASAGIHVLPESSSSFLDPGPGPEETGLPSVETIGDATAPQDPAVGASTHLIVSPPAPIATPPAPAVPPVAAELPAELVSAAAEAIPGASREWVRALLRDCGGYGLDLALLVVAWVKIRRADKPGRYARVALGGWLNQLRAGELTLEDVRAEVQGRTGPRASPRPFDPSVCLARMASLGWTLTPIGPDRVKWSEIPDRSASLWGHVPSDLRQQLEEHKAELKAYVLRRSAERGKAVSHSA
jgi:hypothetical protein